MNKELLNSLPAGEQPIASKLNSLADDMQLSQTFQWELETRLMEKAKQKSQPVPGWTRKVLPALAWMVVAIGALFLLNWAIGSLKPSPQPANEETAVPQASFETRVRQGDICSASLAAGHDFGVFLTNPNKTGLLPLDEDRTIGELRSFAWSPDGEQLAILGNTMGHGNIHFTDPDGGDLRYLLSNSELGYLVDAAWSRDGRQILTWSGPENQTLILLSTEGVPPVEKQLDVRILGTPQFTPDGKSIVFYGADANAAGLFEIKLDGSAATLVNPSVEDGSGFAFSPDGSLLAYIEYDRDAGEARLFTADWTTGERTILETWPIPKTPGSSLPDAANLSWSADGKIITFDFGRGERDRAVYVAYADGAGTVKAADFAHAPAISPDGNCLAFISKQKLFLLDLAGVSPTSMTATALMIDLPQGRAIADFKLDKLQWRP